MKQPVYLFDSEMNYPAAFGPSLTYPSVSYVLELSPIEAASKPVTSEEELSEVLNQGGNVILAGNLELTKPISVAEGVTVKMNLNGHDIVAATFAESGGEIAEGTTDSYAVWAKAGTIELNGDGNVTAQEAKYSMAVWANGGDVVINGGNYTNGGSGCDLVYASGNSTITINGGTFKATPKGDEPGTANAYSALNIKDKDRATAKIIVKGGRFYKFDPANNVSEGAGTNFVAEGYESVADGDWFVVRKIS